MGGVRGGWIGEAEDSTQQSYGSDQPPGCCILVPDGQQVSQDDQVMERALSLVKKIAQGPLSSFAVSKKLIYTSHQTSLEAQLEQERDYLAACAAHPNGREGITAFLEKRDPLYR